MWKSVSVCMATYNGENVVARQILSILNQLSIKDELIIVDDCSTDKTVRVINEIKDDRIRLIINSTNLGVNKSFEKALLQVKGDIVFLSDQDDVWLPNKKKVILDYFMKTKYDVLQHDARVVDENGEVISNSFFEWRGYCGPGIIRNLIRDTHLGCCMAMRKSVINDCMPITSIPYHDKWIGIVAPIMGHRVKYVPDVLINYIRRNGATTSKHLKRRKIAIIFCERILYLKEIVKFVCQKIRKKSRRMINEL